MNFAGIMLSETSHSPEDQYCMIPLVCGTLCNQISEDRVEGGGLPGAGGAKWELPFCV